MPYGQSHTSTLPTVGSTAGPTYATQINDAIEELRETLDVKVTPAGMDINTDLSFLSGGTYYSAVDLNKVNWYNQSAALNATTHPRSVYVVNGELYYNDAAGNQIQVTSGGSVNVSTTGGITGTGYGTGGVEVNWDSSNATYRMRTGTGTNDFADVACDDVILNDGSSNTVRVTAGSMSADYTLTLPTATPASTSLLTMNSSGALTTTRAPSVDTVTTTGAITGGGLITGNAGVTAAANQHVTVSGTGRFKHGELRRQISVFAGVSNGTWSVLTNPGYVQTSTNNQEWVVPIDLEEGKRIKTIRGVILDNTSATLAMSAYKTTQATRVQLGATQTSASTATWQTLQITSLTETVAANYHYFVSFVSSGSQAVRISLVEVIYDHI